MNETIDSRPIARLPRLRSATTALVSVAFALALVALPAAVSAGGFWIFETGSAGYVSSGGAHWGAGADDATTAFTNPAAMTLVESSEVIGQLTGSFYRYRFDRDSATTVSGGSGGNTTFGPLLGAFGVYAAGERLRFGISMNGLAGGTLDYGNSWSGRYLVSEVSLSALGVTPTAAYQITDWLSIGGGPIFGHMSLDQRARVNNLLPAQGDGRLELRDQDFGFGGVVGVLVEPREGTRLALTYRTPMEFDINDQGVFHNILPPLDGALTASGVADAQIDLNLEVPQQLLLGVSQRITDELTVFANADWERWSKFGAAELVLADPDATSAKTNLDSDDTWHVGIGARWRRALWTFTGGFGYDSSMFSKGSRSPVMPMDRQIRVGAGVERDLLDHFRVGLSYEYMNGGQAQLRSGGGGPLTGTLSGDYEYNEIHFVTVSLAWQAAPRTRPSGATANEN